MSHQTIELLAYCVCVALLASAIVSSNRLAFLLGGGERYDPDLRVSDSLKKAGFIVFVLGTSLLVVGCGVLGANPCGLSLTFALGVIIGLIVGINRLNKDE